MMKRLIAFWLLFYTGIICLQQESRSAGVLLLAAPPSGTCSQSNSFIARTSGLDTTHKNAYATLICGLVTDGIWSTLDAFYYFGTQDSTTAALSLVSATFNATVSAGNTFVADTGFTGNGTTSNIDTNFNPSTATSPKFVQDNANMFAWSNTNAAQGSEILGQQNAFSILFPRFSGDLFISAANNNNANNSVANTLGTGIFAAERTGASAVQSFRNGASLFSAATGSIAVRNITFKVIGNIIGGSNQQVCAAGIGSSLGTTLQATQNTRLRAFNTAVSGGCV